MNLPFAKVVFATAALALCSVAFAQAPQSPITHLPSLHKPAVAPKPPAHGVHRFEHHHPDVHKAVAKHAQESCDHLAHHFVGTVSHAAFMKECHNTHHAVLTHVPGALASAAGAAKGAAKK